VARQKRKTNASKSKRKRSKKRNRKRLQWMTKQLALWMTGIVVLLHVVMLLTWWLAPSWNPPRVQLFELIWAWMHQPTFYPFVALVIGGPTLSVFAWHITGKHHRVIAVSWCVFMALLVTQFSGRAMMMGKVLWWAVFE
jgi:hypothetical protein